MPPKKWRIWWARRRPGNQHRDLQRPWVKAMRKAASRRPRNWDSHHSGSCRGRCHGICGRKHHMALIQAGHAHSHTGKRFGNPGPSFRRAETKGVDSRHSSEDALEAARSCRDSWNYGQCQRGSGFYRRTEKRSFRRQRPSHDAKVTQGWAAQPVPSPVRSPPSTADHFLPQPMPWP